MVLRLEHLAVILEGPRSDVILTGASNLFLYPARSYQGLPVFFKKNWLRGTLVPQLIKVCAVSHVILNLLT